MVLVQDMSIVNLPATQIRSIVTFIKSYHYLVLVSYFFRYWTNQLKQIVQNRRAFDTYDNTPVHIIILMYVK